jgi:multimeric flavodoxin WrbA
MKTLIFNGSPRKSGDTVSLINKMTENLNGEYLIIHVYESGIQPCIDCRSSGCILERV